jgi:serine/threonine protein kinase
VFDYLALSGTLTEFAFRAIVNQILKGLIFAKENGIPHEALKPENLLFANDFRVKISDFGLGKRQDWSPFTAPEVLSDAQYEPFSGDIFSLGALLYSLQFGFLPFDQATHNDAQYHLFQTNKSFFWQQRRGRLLFPTPSHQFIALVDWMCAHDPSDRPTLEEVQAHGWMTGQMVEETALRLIVARLVRDCEEDRSRKKSLHLRRKAVQSAGNSFRGLEYENDIEDTRTPAQYHHFRSTYFRLFCLFTPIQTAYLLRSLLRNREGYSFTEHPSRYHFEVRYRDQCERETVVRLEVRAKGEVVVLEIRKIGGSFFVYWRLFNLVKAEIDYSESLFSLTA